MKVYNKEKTQELTEFDLAKGFLQDDKLFVRKEPAKKEVKEQSHEEIIAEYPNGGKDIKIVIDVPYQAAQPAKEIYEDIQIYIPYSESALRRRAANQELTDIIAWFNWYDGQVSQAQRAERTKTIWSANDGDKEYTTLAELDAEANEKQAEIRTLKAELSALEA